MLRTPEQVHEYLLDYLSQPGVTLPPGMELGLKAGGLAKGLMAKTIAGQITAMASNFIAGADAASALPTLQRLWNEGVAFSVDLLGEACLSDDEARAYQHRYLDLIETLPAAVAAWPANPLLESDHLGPVPRANVSIKLSALYARTDPIDFEGSLDALTGAPAADPGGGGQAQGVRQLRHGAVRPQGPDAGAVPALLRGSTTFRPAWPCRPICEAAWTTPSGSSPGRGARGRQVTVRLIKGAYWDYEVIHAEQMGWPVPVWTDKRQTDACFEQMAERLVAATPRRPARAA